MAVRTKKLTPKQKRKKSIRLIVKANQLVEAKYMFDVWEMRVFLSLVSLISSNDDDEKVYRIWYKEIKNNFKIKFKSYKFLREAANRLFDKSLVVGYMKDGYEREKKHHLIRSVDALKEGQEGVDIKSQEYIDVKIDSDIRPYLLDIRKRFDPLHDRYTSYELRNIIDLQSYGIRIYELLKQFEKVGHRVIKVQVLKDAFNITNEYPRFSNFYQKVIQKSIMDINKKTDITVPLDEIEKIKKGRKIESLRFLILTKSKKELAELRGETIQGTLFDAQKVEVISPEQEQTKADLLYNEFEDIVVKKFGVTPSVFLKMVVSGKYPKQAIQQAIEVTRRAKFNQEIKKSVAGFFVMALRGGFTDEKREKKKQQNSKEKAIKQQLEQLEKEYANKRAEKVKLILEQEEKVREKTLAYLKDCANSILEKRIKSLGLSMDNITIDAFRKDKTLRSFFIQGIVHEYKGQFIELEREYKERKIMLKS